MVVLLSFIGPVSVILERCVVGKHIVNKLISGFFVSFVCLFLCGGLVVTLASATKINSDVRKITCLAESK